MEATYIGGIAGFMTSIAVIPQMIKTWKTRHARDLSLWQQIIVIVGLSLWLCYGLILGDIPLIASNTFTLVCYSLLLGMKIIYDRADKRRTLDCPDTKIRQPQGEKV
jgi:MtN3 and saliva related transmembrane protein